MPDIELQLRILYQRLGQTDVVCEAVAFPEFSFFGVDEGVAERMVLEHARAIVESSPARDLYARNPAGRVYTREIVVKVEPPKRSDVWREAVELTFPVVVNQRPEGKWTGNVPAIQVGAMADTEDELLKKLRRESLMALQRTKATKTLLALVQLQRVQGMELRALKLTARLRPPKQMAQEEEKEAKPPSVLEEVATDLVRQSDSHAIPRAYEIKATLEAMAEALTGQDARSILLVGEVGVGKTAAVYELVHQRKSLGLANTAFWSTSGSRLIAGAIGFGAWQERCTALIKEVAKAKAVLYVGNVVELTEIGKSNSNSTGIAAFLRPAIVRGQLLLIAECTPEQAALLDRKEPQLLSAFRGIKVPEPTATAVGAILSQIATEYPCGIRPEAVRELERLHRRYGVYSPFPGRAARFLKNLLARRVEAAGAKHLAIEPGNLRKILRQLPEIDQVHEREIVAVFAAQSGLPRFMLDEEVPLDLEAAEEWFKSRLMGQTEAVSLVVDLLATVKAGLSRPRRPTASLMFVGPTGVGKTEMAKNIAEYFFSDRSRLTRFDMSEYSTSHAVSRLIGTGFQDGLMTGAVRQQPFSVILLDEIEKAHPAMFDLLLQILGDGRLTDASGRVADFTNSIVIMTSNLGAENFERQAFGLTRSHARNVGSRFLEAVREFMRPELFNRIDRVVPFLPLSRAAVAAIAAREMELVRGRDGIKLRGVDLHVTPAASAHLAEAGYDDRYGARPLKRVLERQILAPLSEAINGYSNETAMQAHVDTGESGIVVKVRKSVGQTSPAIERSVPEEIVLLRRRSQRLQKCTALRRLLNDIDQLTRQVAHALASKKNHPDLAVWQEKLSTLRTLASRAKAGFASVVSLEDDSLAVFYGDAGKPQATWNESIQAAKADLRVLMLELYAIRFGSPHRATMMFLSDDIGRSFELARIYQRIALKRKATISAVWYGSDRRGRLRHRVENVEDFLKTPPAKAWGFAMMFSGEHLLSLLAGESGSHVFEVSRSKQEFVNISVTGDLLDKIEPPENVERPGTLIAGSIRRTFHLGTGEFVDHALGESRRGSLVDAVTEFVDKSLLEAVEGILRS